MVDVTDVVRWATTDGICKFVNTDDGEFYAVSLTPRGHVHFIPLPLSFQEEVEKTEAADSNKFIIRNVAARKDAQDLWESLSGRPEFDGYPKETTTLFSSQAREEAVDDLARWFQDGIYEDIAAHYEELVADLSNMLDDEEDPSAWGDEDMSRYQYLFLPVLKTLYGAYYADGEVFIHNKDEDSDLYFICSHMYSTQPFMIIANDDGEPEIYPLELSEEEAMELVDVGDWDILSDDTEADTLFRERLQRPSS